MSERTCICGHHDRDHEDSGMYDWGTGKCERCSCPRFSLDTSLSDKEKLHIALKALRHYANIDCWFYRGYSNGETDENFDPKYTSFEMYDHQGVHDGWDWAQQALNKIGDVK